NSNDYWKTRLVSGKEAAYQRIQADQMPFGLASTPRPGVMTFTNFLGPQKEGVGILKLDGTTWKIGTYVPIELGSDQDAFDVENPREIAITPDGSLAFVLGYDIPASGGFTYVDGLGLI